MKCARSDQQKLIQVVPRLVILRRDVIDPVAVRFGMETTASGTDGTQAFRERFGWLIASITGNFLPK
jgi:hypothetical protein